VPQYHLSTSRVLRLSEQRTWCGGCPDFFSECLSVSSLPVPRLPADQPCRSLEKVVCLGEDSMRFLVNLLRVYLESPRRFHSRGSLCASLTPFAVVLTSPGEQALPSPRLCRGRRGSRNRLALSFHQEAVYWAFAWPVPLARPDARTTHSEPVRCSFLARPSGTPASSALSLLILRTGNRLEAGHSDGLAGRA